MIKRLFTFVKISLVALCLFGGIFGISDPVFAQAQDNLDAVSEAAEIDGGEQDLRIIIARIINTALSFLGIIAVIIVLYGGFTWMTSAGNPDKLARAKKILINGLIGLTIIFLSWAITAFVLSALINATGAGGGGGTGSDSSGGGSLGGGGSSSSFAIADVAPQGAIPIRNVIVQSTFTRTIDAETVSNDSFSVIRVSDGIPVAGELDVSGNSIDFTPEAACPDPNSDRNCFDANTEYQIRITSALESTSGVNLLECLTTCTFNFTTGDIVDVDDPDVSLTVPDNNDGFPVGEVVGVQATATDDYYVGAGDFYVDDTFFDSVIGTGDTPADVTIDTVWDTASPVVTQVGESYLLEVRVTDLAGNTASDSISVNGNPAYCFNGVFDDGETPPEEGIDCGGLCGACDGSVCSSDADCAGSCVNGQCVSAPEITDISPRDGAVGNYVTIFGTHFGGATGTVYFSDGAGGRVEAPFPACADAWDDNQILVEVPAGAGDGPIFVETSAGITDSTNDDAGPFIEDFDVNDVVRPRLCKLSPDNGGVGVFMDMIGSGFGTLQLDSEVIFTPVETGSTTDVRTYNNWSDTNIELVIPALQENDYTVQVLSGGVNSNALLFALNEEDVSAPAISAVNPESGGPGQYITITGNDFGGSVGLVWFESIIDGTQIIADTSFPDACGTDFWDPDQVTVKVPDVVEGQYNVFIERASDSRQSNRVDFSVTNASPSPGICTLLPDSGAVGDEIRIIGEGFGSTSGSVAFYNEAPANITDWNTEEVVVSVPASASTGPLTITAASGLDSNALNFELSGEGTGTATDIGASYSWRFSTGQIPITPRLVQECTASSVSAVPSDSYNDAVCVNAIVYGYFDTLMDESTLNAGTILLEECNNDSCSNTTPVSSDIHVSSSTGATQFHLRPVTDSGRLAVSTKYQVTVTVGAESLDGTPMDRDVSWTFTTTSDATDCDIEEVSVQPSNEVLTAEGQTAEFNAIPKADNCIILDASDYSWNWSLETSIADLNETCEDIQGDSCVVAEALVEGETLLLAQTTGSGVEGSSDLTINFTDPYIDNYWPNCTTACVNADIGASFNIAMDPTEIEATNRVKLFECETEFCLNFTEVSDSASCIDEGNGCTRVSVDLPAGFNLDAQTYYRVLVSGQVTSESGVPLTRLNYGNDYSWTFLTREDGSICSVDRIALEPEEAVLEVVGQTQQFAATPYGSPDSCSVAGQRLNGYDFSWNWTNPIDDSSNSDADIASWVNLDGSLVDTDQDQIPEGCSGSCLAQGSTEVFALCGNGIIERGEDCDDGNTLSGDTCSPSCEFEGSNTCSQACSSSGQICTTDNDCDVGAGESCSIFGTGCCGDGVVSGGEECDDGNVQNGDGCSAICLNEGSQAAGVTCGDGIVSGLPGSGGEECDDGNKANGDGCSSVCLNEGSESFSDVAAVCGNGVIESPYETCDDGNLIQGDGCSDRCLREGISSSQSTGFVCGNGIIEQVSGTSAGEDCDGEAGCTSECLLAGSSLSYASPSVCGDGIIGTGELAVCELGAVGDGAIDPVQLAQIDDDAAASVGEDGEATQLVEVSLNDLTTTSDLTLLCSAESDDDCPAGFGADENGCCSAYPSIELYPNAADVCLNSAIYLISDKKMDPNSFINNAYVRLDDGPSSCPSSHNEFVEDQEPLAWVWQQFKRLFVLSAHAQVAGDCLVPISSFEQSSLDDGRWKVSFKTSMLLEPDALYSIVVEDGADGILTDTGIVLDAGEVQPFKTGTEICELDVVSIVDQTGDVQGLFTRFDDDHDMLAIPYTFKGSVREEIQPVPGVYDWTWQDWQEDSDGTVFDVSLPVPARPDVSRVSPQGVNGEATLVAQAQIIEEGIVSDETVAGSLDLVALLCENPWPSASQFPFEDSLDGLLRGISGLSASPAWMNFSSYYCRGRAEGALLPELSVVAATDPATEDVIKEYFFAVGGTSDVIGIRIASNPDYLSPSAWYAQQGFNGNPSPTTVDGFEAVQDGRTMYVSAPNDNIAAHQLYSNIYVISYNEGASDATISIYDQMLANWNFATNIKDIRLCRDGGQYTGTVCSSDLDCQVEAGEICAAVKDKLARDTKRLADLSTIEANLFSYATQNKRCSATTNQVCTVNTDCPIGESCIASYPELESGTFVRSISSSAWDSWNTNFADVIGGAPVDPLSQYYGCGSICSNTREACTTNSDCGDGGSCIAMPNPDNETNTCVNQTLGEYVCPLNSYTYHYRSIGPFGYELSAELEYRIDVGGTKSYWVNPIDANTSDDLDILVGRAMIGSGDGFLTSGAFCDGTTYGGSSTCGDGIVGVGEVCEVGQQGTGAACDANGDGSNDGYRATVCNDTCTGFTETTTSTCVAYACGNGIQDPGEICDDGSLNGSYGFCNNDCSGFDFFCGDGSIAGGEVCDCSTSGASGLTSGGSACTVSNGVYAANPGNTCAWDCGGAGPHCGDNIIQSGEQCDGSVDIWEGQLCVGGFSDGMPCNTNADCAGIGLCGIGATWAGACPNTQVCLAGSNQGLACSTDSDCPGSQCSTFNVQTTRTRTCADNGAAGDTCQWNQSSWQGISCKAPGACGNGELDEGEECDDGNDSDTDSCSNLCTLNVCGDGFLYEGVEQCDEGSQNGVVCSAAYGSTCTYCSSSCRVLSSSGAFCGDAVIGGGEICDAGDLSYVWLSGGLISTNYDIDGYCAAGTTGAQNGTHSCLSVGACNGGVNYDFSTGQTVSFNGVPCASSSQCGTGGECVFPTCASSCGAQCPFDYTNTEITFLDNQVGASRSRTINLLSTEEAQDLDVLGDPTAATVYVPACRVAKDLTIDIDDSERELPAVEVIMVLDRSVSMGFNIDGDQDLNGEESRIEILADAASNAIDRLFDEYAVSFGGEIKIGLVTIDNSHFVIDQNNNADYSQLSDKIIDPLTSYNDRSNLLEEFEGSGAFTSAVAWGQFHGTPILRSIDQARDMFSGDADTEMMIFFTDGEIYNSTTEYREYGEYVSFSDTNGNGDMDQSEYLARVTQEIDEMKDAGIEVYSAVLTSLSCDILQMERWSSMSCTANGGSCTGKSAQGNYSCSPPSNGRTYAYNASTAEEIDQMFEDIVNSILNITITLDDGDETAAIELDAGVGSSIPIPSSFACNGVGEQEITIRASFLDQGTGTVTLSNPRINMCTP